MIDFYTNEDPVLAAQATSYNLRVLAIIQTAQILSAVWGRLNPELLTMDWKQSSIPVPEIGMWRYVGIGDFRIYPAETWGGYMHSAMAWATSYGGNYDWLYKYGTELCELFRQQSKKRVPYMLEPVIRTLELCPPALLDTVGTFSDFKELT